MLIQTIESITTVFYMGCKSDGFHSLIIDIELLDLIVSLRYL